MAFEKKLAFFIFLEVLDTYEVQWFTKIMYVSSITPLTKTKPKFPFPHIVYECCMIQDIWLQNKWVGIEIAFELIPLREGGTYPPVLANHSLEEKAEGLYF